MQNKDILSAMEMSVCLPVWARLFVCVCLFAHVFVCVRVSLCVFTFVFLCARVRVCVFVCPVATKSTEACKITSQKSQRKPSMTQKKYNQQES